MVYIAGKECRHVVFVATVNTRTLLYIYVYVYVYLYNSTLNAAAAAAAGRDRFGLNKTDTIEIFLELKWNIYRIVIDFLFDFFFLSRLKFWRSPINWAGQPCSTRCCTIKRNYWNFLLKNERILT